jgi:hypothetical protein
MEWFQEPHRIDCANCEKAVLASFADLATGKFHCPWCGSKFNVGNAEEVLGHAAELMDGSAHIAVEESCGDEPAIREVIFPAVFERLKRMEDN